MLEVIITAWQRADALYLWRFWACSAGGVAGLVFELYDPVSSKTIFSVGNSRKAKGGQMFRKKKIQQADYDRENWKPLLKCSICNGERVAGFQNIHTKEFKEECFIKEDADLEEFMQKYGITDITREY